MTPIDELRNDWEESDFDIELVYSRWDEGEPSEVCSSFRSRFDRAQLRCLADWIDQVRDTLEDHDGLVDPVELTSDLSLTRGDTSDRLILQDWQRTVHVSWRPSASFEALLVIAMDATTLDLAAGDLAELLN